jgi:HAD superfamily hydrolase (TIGR01509 family)
VDICLSPLKLTRTNYFCGMQKNIDLSRFKAVIYDMDGVLIDTEPFWKMAEEKIFATVGIDFNSIPNQETVGMRIDEVVGYWHQHYPWEGKSIEQVAQEIMDEMERYIRVEGKAMKGVEESIKHFSQRGMKIGLATSSYERLMHATLDRLGITDFFHCTVSAEHLSQGKPHPLIYLETAKQLNVSPANCLVIEDSINGIKAGKAAGMFVVAIPDGSHQFSEGFEQADLISDNLLELIQ